MLVMCAMMDPTLMEGRNAPWPPRALGEASAAVSTVTVNLTVTGVNLTSFDAAAVLQIAQRNVPSTSVSTTTAEIVDFPITVEATVAASLAQLLRRLQGAGLSPQNLTEALENTVAAAVAVPAATVSVALPEMAAALAAAPGGQRRLSSLEGPSLGVAGDTLGLRVGERVRLEQASLKPLRCTSHRRC